MKIYNTLTRKTEHIEPLAPPKVTVYTCGPTVYDYPHIGNWFTFLRYDVLVRALKASGFAPKWVMNITDVGHLVSDDDEGEDKLEKGAKREGKTAWEIAAFYSKYFTDGLKRLNITSPDVLPRATEHITEQIDMIKSLEDKGFTYVISDGVYFDTSKLSDYGKLAKLDIEHLREGARVEPNPEKRNPTDFALWKFSPDGHQRDMEWQSPWGNGFPGWHIECSAMSIRYLGEILDIHGGGIDHIPVHHTNEIAQSEAATGKPFAKYWFHANHIMVNGKKIAKSLGNGITLEDIEAKGCTLGALRMLVLESHYRSQAQFSWDSLSAASNRLADVQALADLRFQISPDATPFSKNFFAEYKKQLLDALSDDLDTPSVLRILSDLVTKVEASGHTIHPDQAGEFTDFLTFLDNVLGLNLLGSADISNDQRQLLSKRQEARDKKDWAISDRLRGKLQEDGIGLKDTATGQIWYRL